MPCTEAGRREVTDNTWPVYYLRMLDLQQRLAAGLRRAILQRYKWKKFCKLSNSKRGLCWGAFFYSASFVPFTW